MSTDSSNFSVLPHTSSSLVTVTFSGAGGVPANVIFPAMVPPFFTAMTSYAETLALNAPRNPSPTTKRTTRPQRLRGIRVLPFTSQQSAPTPSTTPPSTTLLRVDFLSSSHIRTENKRNHHAAILLLVIL